MTPARLQVLRQLAEAQRVYARDENVVNYLRDSLSTPTATPDMIEVAYDLQAGSYTAVSQTPAGGARIQQFAGEIAQIIEPHVRPGGSLLDVGTGEGTTIGPIAAALGRLAWVGAVDISTSRVHWARKNLKASLHLAVAGMEALPLGDACVDTVMTVHALEPNGGREAVLLAELARVAHSKVILIEPHYEAGSASQRARMDRLGYVKGISEEAASIGLTTEACVPIRHNANPDNAASVFILNKSSAPSAPAQEPPAFWSCPLTHERLAPDLGGLVAWESGLWYPILDGIPILRAESGVVVAGIARDRLESATRA